MACVVKETLLEHQQGICSNFQPKKTKGTDHQQLVSDYVSKNKGRCIDLKKPAGAKLRIKGLNDTIYKGNDEEVYEWGNFYLCDIVNMEVFGVVEGVGCQCEQLVVMTCEDEKVYAYDGEELHLVNSNWTKLQQDKIIEYPSSRTFYNGEAFKDLTKDDWSKVRSGPVGQKLEKKHQELVNRLL